MAGLDEEPFRGKRSASRMVRLLARRRVLRLDVLEEDSLKLPGLEATR
jgi:hypothetical protein